MNSDTCAYITIIKIVLQQAGRPCDVLSYVTLHNITYIGR